MYIDSRELEHHVAPALLDIKRRYPAHHSGGSGHLEVPVLVFQLQRDTPVLIDEHYSAKALEGMVVVVQNAARQ